MIGGAVGLFLLVRAAGSTLVAPAPAFTVSAANTTSAKADVLLHVLLALVVVIIAARAFGALCRRIHQPPVIGEVIAGVFLGPSLLGRLIFAAPAGPLSPVPTGEAAILQTIAPKSGLVRCPSSSSNQCNAARA